MFPTLTENRKLRTTVFCLLYFAQGAPWGFVTVALLSKLTEAGHDKVQTATITALAIMPWTFKFFWAPMIDSFHMPSMGLRRPWIMIAQFGMLLSLGCIWFTGDLGELATLKYVAWAFFVHNCFASLQDVATDALAVDLLDDTERGRVNGMMWASKLFGIGVGGAGMGKIMAYSDLQTAVVAQAILVGGVLCFVIAFRERTGERLLPWLKGQASAALQVGATRSGDVVAVVRELFRALSLRTTYLAALMAVTVNLCDGLYVPLNNDLFVRVFEWKAVDYTSLVGTWGVAAELFGALLGGFLCDRWGRRRMAGLGALMTSASLLTFGMTSGYWDHPSYPAWLIVPLVKGSMAFTTVSLFSLYMKISWSRAAATQFTLYMALSNVGHMLGTKLNSINVWIGKISDQSTSLADHGFYLVAGCVALLPLGFLPFLRPNSVVEHAQAETSQKP